MKYVLIFAMFFICCSYVFADEAWEMVTGIKESGIKEVAVNGDIIYAASAKRLYRSEDSGRTWNAVFLARGEDSVINFIDIFRNSVFVCTNKGLFKSIDGKIDWKKIFQGVGAEENSAQHIAFKNHEIYLGTKGGLFVTNDNGATWHKDSGEAGNLSIKWIVFLEEDVFLAAEKGVYKTSGPDWKRVFITSTEEIEYDTDSQDEGVDAAKPVNSIFVKDKDIFLATDSGIFISENEGESWQRFESAGLGSEKINRILFKDNLYAAADKGVFVFNYEDEQWHALYKGIDADRIYSISADNKNRIWVATDKGLYRHNSSVIASPPEADEAISFDLFSHEPTIRQVQEAAIEYAEVNPDKIKQWRSAAGKKALLPNLSVGLDRYVTDYWHWDSGANPDVLVKGDDAISWDVTMTWNLGELIWNDDQTSIDVRSKLMVQLRDDILSETTRAYFERRRLQIETDNSSPMDLKAKMEKDLRIQELTADLDGLTGGYFSERIE